MGAPPADVCALAPVSGLTGAVRDPMMRAWVLSITSMRWATVRTIAAIGAIAPAQTLARGCGEGLHFLFGQLRSGAFDGARRPLGVRTSLVANGGEFSDTSLQGRIVQVGDAVLDGLVELLQLGVGLRGALAQFGDVGPPAPSAS